MLLWTIGARRLEASFALDRAVEHARALGQPLLVVEPLRCGSAWSSERVHAFVLDGMAEHARALEARGIAYHPYVEPVAGAGAGLLEALGARAAAVVTDDPPAFFFPRMIEAAGRALDVLLEAVDGNGLLPLRALDRALPAAASFRRALQARLREVLREPPEHAPLDHQVLAGARIDPAIAERWPAVSTARLEDRAWLAELPIDHAVPPTAERGGAAAARVALTRFLDRLPGYAQARNRPDEDATSGLSPWLHFGHLSTWTVLDELGRREGWTPLALGARATGAREGWWGMGADAEAFLDQLVTWRELGLNSAAHLADFDRYDALPEWARRTLAEHEADPRPHLYEPADLDAARTHDPLWNAAQTQLVREGRIHTYLRMLWGKKVLEWSRTPREAFEILVDLNNRYALDGRDPNSYAGIAWTFGRYDRPWPERPIYGTVRSMSSANTARKVPVRAYLERYGSGAGTARRLW